MAVDLAKIDKLGKALQSLKLDLASLEGQQVSILNTLKKDYGIDNLAEARKELQSMETESEELQEKIASLLAKADEVMKG
jgi:peptidoglycan hydrolase CwlO-like protein